MNTRVLCLGNALLADDALGPEVARRLRHHSLDDREVMETAETGFYLLEYVLGCSRLIVIDVIASGAGPPGTIYQLREQDVASPPGASPHYVGLFETVAVARGLGLPVPTEITVFAVEAADLTTIGGAMSEAVCRALPGVLAAVEEAVRGAQAPPVVSAAEPLPGVERCA